MSVTVFYNVRLPQQQCNEQLFIIKLCTCNWRVQSWYSLNLNLFIPTDVHWGSNGQSITITERIIRTLTRVFTSEIITTEGAGDECDVTHCWYLVLTFHFVNIKWVFLLSFLVSSILIFTPIKLKIFRKIQWFWFRLRFMLTCCT